MRIDIVHDTACPWCRIGKHNLQLALADRPDEPVTIGYLPYFLNPDMPPDGRPYREHMQKKFAGTDIRQVHDGPTRAGAATGLTFHFDKIERAPNTILSHRLIALAPDDRRDAVVDAVYDAYFEHGKDITQRDVLLDAAESAGLDRAQTAAQFDSDEGVRDVVEQAAQMYERGVQGVPLFIFDSKWALSGAQPPDVFAQVLDRIASGDLQ